MEERICGLIVAAGLSSRMGCFKPLLPLRGKTVIENTIDSMLLCGISPVVVVLGYRGREVEAVLRSRYLAGTVIPVYNRDFASTDMLASIQLGAAALPPCSAFFLMPGDMPVVTKETFLTVCRARSGGVPSITFPTLDGYRKHPPLIDRAFIPGICSYQGPDGLRGFWRLHEDTIATVPVDDAGCWTDLDTYEQYRACLQRVGSEPA